MISVPVGETRRVSIGHLQLDADNPRLFGHSTVAGDEEIIASLYRAAELDELLQSISANGYLDIEPLVVTEDGAGGDHLVVLEGNRRLAALRILREEELVARLRDSWNLRILVPAMSPELRPTMAEVSVHKVSSRAAARPFLGFKHINGPAKWDAYAKGKFAADWYRSGGSKGVKIDDIASAIGDRHDTIKRMVAAIYVLEQAEKSKLFSVNDRYTKRFNFSHLYTALSRSQYMEYLDLGTGWVRYEPRPNPVPVEKAGELQRLLVWIYGSKDDDRPPIVRSQNPDIKRLGFVLGSHDALLVLNATRSLDAAYAQTESVDTRFTTSLIRGRDALRAAVSSLRAYDGQDKSLLEIAEDVKETADILVQRMEKKYRDATRD